MILYVDTSALVPLLVSEPRSHVCGELWDRADRVITARLTYVEAAASLAMAERIGRITAEQSAASRNALDELWAALDVIELDHRLMVSAADVAASQGLRGYDAVHCAAATELGGDDVVAAAGDTRLLAAWADEGITVVDINA
ncbi:MAG TPA: type II toxin-antitoxin system VapC family toxin [Nocardioidaceae bacterium]|nr:type II toxin-antitoxin system VapC family toxin [Nocardioidaceae bacterium]